MHHLRNGEKQEWSEYPQRAGEEQLTLGFVAKKNPEIQVLRIRQQDVKQAWQVKLNEHLLGELDRDENDRIKYFEIPAGMLLTGDNMLRIFSNDTISDDVRVGQIALEEQPLSELLTEATVHIEIVEWENKQLLPSRITVVNEEGALQPVGKISDGNLAIRPGLVYTGSGKASFGLPAGKYTMYAGRGFEYAVDSLQIRLELGDQLSKRFTIRQEVPTEGWVSSDTHIHTFTHSGHGDATVEERALTIAGEGIELPILTDHNLHVDIGPTAKAMQVESFFTPVIGNEVTTKIGHFNIFPVTKDSPVPDINVEDWNAVSLNIGRTPGVEAVILNHPRDTHSGFRPFGEKRHLSEAGWDLEDWKVPANAMEVVNSGAQQTDRMRLFQDWFGMLNRGIFLTPVGSSDSHDVGRYLVGQARTYIRSESENPGHIAVSEAVDNFIDGKVMVSFGLLAEMVVDKVYGPGDIVPASDELVLSLRVLGPSWVRADRITLYANGQKIREAAITEESIDKAGIKWSGTWTLARPTHDIFLVAIAEGPGNTGPFWPIAKPYQPVSPDWAPGVIGATGAVWIDADLDGHRSSALDYAKELVNAAEGNTERLLEILAPYDEAVAIQTASLLQQQGMDMTAPAFSSSLKKAAPATRVGFFRFMKAWKSSQGQQ